MSDITERLRREWWQVSDVDCKTAADEIERLRAVVAGLREDAERYHEWKRAFREGECALWNALCECQSDAEHDAAIDAALAARKGEATTPPPSPSPRS